MLNLINKLIQKRKRNKQLKETDYGRNKGWNIEIDGIKVGELINPKVRGQLRYEYELVLCKSNFIVEIRNNTFWERNDLMFFSKSMKEYAKYNPIVHTNVKNDNSINTVRVRYLYID